MAAGEVVQSSDLMLPLIGCAGDLNLANMIKFLCTLPDKMKEIHRVFPNAIEPGSGRVRIAGITAGGCTWELIELITQHLREIRAGPLSPLPAQDKLKFSNQIIKLCAKFREYGRDGVPTEPLIIYVYRAWKSINDPFPKPYDVWQSADITQVWRHCLQCRHFLQFRNVHDPYIRLHKDLRSGPSRHLIRSSNR